MKQYEVTFIVDPVLSGDEIKMTASTYSDMLTDEGCKIVHFGELGLKQLAYPINKRNSGVYYCIEFTTEAPAIIGKVELAFRRDERIMRFLTVHLDKYGIKYNQDKRDGKIGMKRTVIVESTAAAGANDTANKQDLTKIEGIGPKLSELLAASSILTYDDLAKSSVENLKAILEGGGAAFSMHNPTTWPEQAKLASESKWNELQKLQDTISGGVVVSAEEE
jgi:small subunit ribosomal protein S6